MSDDNLNIWEKFEDIDPKFTKAITGKAYRGTSPNPQYVIKCLTEMFGPVGQGFGWRVVAEAFEPLGQEVLHWCRIEFWHTDRANTFESYGQTKAAYGTNAGKFMVDEDAPKKSLTDAIIKAASHIGIAANIFLGRWDDQKYVAEVNAEYRASERSAAPTPAADETPGHQRKTGSPEYDPSLHIAAIEAVVTGKALLDVVREIGGNNGHPAIVTARVEKLSMLIKGAQTLGAIEAFKTNFGPDWPSVAADAESRRSELLNADLDGDHIPDQGAK